MTLDKKHVEWQRRVIDVLKIGGRWIVPASGAVVERIGEKTVKIIQDGDDDVLLAQIVAHIEAAGFTIEPRVKSPLVESERDDGPEPMHLD